MVQDPADPFRFMHRLRVRWGECDMQGIVFNPQYMVLFDAALTEYWRTLGLTYPAAFLAHGVDSFMVSNTVNYRDAARFDDELDIALRTAYLGTTSFRIAFEIRRDGARLADGTATYVTGDRETRRPVQLAAWLIEAMTGFERVQPERKPSG